MAEIQILSGIYSDEVSDFRQSYPINLMPVPLDSGMSKGYLRPAEGIIQQSYGPGIGRGGINWNNVCYRVMGTSLVSISDIGVVTVIGDVGAGGHCSFAIGWVGNITNLTISSGGRMYYYDGTTLTQIVDPDLGTSLDHVWIDGYWFSTDGQNIVVSTLGTPATWPGGAYAGTGIDPDPIEGLMVLRNELIAVNRYTIEFFRDAALTPFPFERIVGAQIQKGCVGTFAFCNFKEAIVFLGSGRNEAPGVYMGVKANTTKISSAEIDDLLQTFTEDQLSTVVLEVRSSKGRSHLWIRLPDRTAVFDFEASQASGQQVWFYLTSNLNGFTPYRAGDLVWCYNRWLVTNTIDINIGYLSDAISSQWGLDVRWEFGTTILFNEGRGGVFHEMELSALPGRVAFGEDPTIWASWSDDGETWSQPRAVSIGKQGDRTKRIVWRRCGAMRNRRMIRFQSDSQAFISIARLEVQLEGLTV